MNRSVRTLALACLFVLAIFSPLRSNAQSKDEVADKMASVSSYSCGEIFRKLVTLDLSPEIWSYMSNIGASDGMHQISSFAPEMMAFAKRMGWGDLDSLNKNSSTPPEQNPLIGQMVDSWQGKMSLRLVCNFKPTGEAAMRKALANIAFVSHPLEEERIKPRSGKMFLTITASPTASNYSVTAAPDGTHFNIVVPVYQDYSQDGLTNAFAKCAGSGR